MRAFPIALCTALAVSGCSNFLPSAGPSTRAVAEGADVQTNQGLLARYEIIDIDPSVVEAMRGRPLDSLLASFGDRRPAVEAVIGIGDTVSVTIWEASTGGLFSGALTTDRFTAGSKSALIPPQVVARDGTIMVPYAGRVQVAGRRAIDVQTQIEAELAGKAIEPQVIVNVVMPTSTAVTVTGEVIAGARIPLSTRGDRLLDVIASAGGVRAPVSETFVRLSRGSTTATVPLTAVVSNPRENIYLRPGDTLTLVRDPQTFMATGATAANYEIPFSAEGITLAQALAKAGGLSDFQADPAGVFVFRFEPSSLVRRLRPGSPLAAAPQVPVVYRLNMRDPNGLFITQAFRMRNRDVVYVSNAPFADVQKVLSVFSTVTAPVAAGASVYGAVR
ncbi:MAG: polysaccharide export protein [Methylobacterium frigidaeris]